ncbi:MAG: LysE family translocator [Francisella sp.]
MMLIFITIIMLHISCLILPGPDFFVTIGNSIKFGYKSGICTACGVASGIFLNAFIVYWFGSFLFYQHHFLFKFIVFIGVFYLTYVVFNLYKNVFTRQFFNSNTNHHLKNLYDFENSSKFKLFFNGFFTNLANPKVFVFFSSMLSLIDNLSSFAKVITWVTISLTTFVWFCIVAIFFGNDKFRKIFFSNIKKIEFVSAIFITIFIVIILIDLFLE